MADHKDGAPSPSADGVPPQPSAPRHDGAENRLVVVADGNLTPSTSRQLTSGGHGSSTSARPPLSSAASQRQVRQWPLAYEPSPSRRSGDGRDFEPPISSFPSSSALVNVEGGTEGGGVGGAGGGEGEGERESAAEMCARAFAFPSPPDDASSPRRLVHRTSFVPLRASAERSEVDLDGRGGGIVGGHGYEASDNAGDWSGVVVGGRSGEVGIDPMSSGAPVGAVITTSVGDGDAFDNERAVGAADIFTKREGEDGSSIGSSISSSSALSSSSVGGNHSVHKAEALELTLTDTSSSEDSEEHVVMERGGVFANSIDSEAHSGIDAAGGDALASASASSRSRRKCVLLWVAAGLILATAVIVATSVALTRPKDGSSATSASDAVIPGAEENPPSGGGGGGGGSSSSAYPTFAPTEYPTPSPTPKPTASPSSGKPTPTHSPTSTLSPTVNHTALELRLFDVLAAAAPYPERLTSDVPNAAQRAALWLLVQDAEKLLTFTDDRIVRRWGLLTYFYSQGDGLLGPKWMDPDSECDWMGVTCREDDVGTAEDVVITELESVPLFPIAPTIPEEIVVLTDLTVLDLRGNDFFQYQFTGTIPTELGALPNLTRLDLSGNKFVGEVPAELGQLANLENLNLSGNDLGGSMPQEVCDLRTVGGTLESLAADCSANDNGNGGGEEEGSGIDCSWLPGCCTRCCGAEDGGGPC